MVATLASLETRVKNYLSDTTGLSFSAALIDEGIRLALGDYNVLFQLTTAPATINGLDSAPTTTTHANAESPIVLLAAGYAAQARLVKRAESFNLAQKIETDLQTWGRGMISQATRDLVSLYNQIRTQDQHAATVPPFPTATTDAADGTGWLTDDADTTGHDV